RPGALAPAPGRVDRAQLHGVRASAVGPRAGRQPRPHEGREALRPRARRAPRILRDPLDQGGDPRIHPAQLAHGEDRHHQGAAQALLQPAQHEADDVLAHAQGDPADGEDAQREGERGHRDGAAAPGGDVPLEPSPDDAADEAVTPIAYLADMSEGPAESYEREQGEALKTEGLARALESLDERTRRIIRARWLAESDP